MQGNAKKVILKLQFADVVYPEPLDMTISCSARLRAKCVLQTANFRGFQKKIDAQAGLTHLGPAFHFRRTPERSPLID